MIHWIVFPLALVLAILVLLVVLRAVVRYLVTPRPQTFDTATEVRHMLNPPHSSLAELLQARATPNQRLVHAFGLTNTFVSADPKVHKAFTAKAKALISSPGKNGTSGEWDGLARIVSEVTRRFLHHQQNDVEFANFIQCITLCVVLSSLFHADPETLHHDDVVYVTDIINKRWTDSKTKDPTTMNEDDSLPRIIDCINGWIGDTDQYPDPLNFILPAYETMWRVVAVAIAYTYRHHDSPLHDTMISFAKDPTEERFEAFKDDSKQPSMQAVILEVLRLHPPTRHISRASAASDSGSGSWWHWDRVLSSLRATISIADIEAVHRTAEFGENAAEFDPMRFHPSRMQRRAELFAFGYGRLGCVAAKWAPMAAAVIAAKVIEEMDECGFSVMVGPKIGGRTGWDGWMVAKEA